MDIACDNFYDAWRYLDEHTIFKGRFNSCLDIDVAKVNPDTGKIENDISKNTKTEVWLECGPWERDCLIHDLDLDCGGDTFEDAIIKLAELVRLKYDK